MIKAIINELRFAAREVAKGFIDPTTWLLLMLWFAAFACDHHDSLPR